MPEILGFVTEPELLDFSRNFLVTRPNEPVDALFEDRKTENLFAEYQTLAAIYQIPAMATVHAFDSEAEIGQRVPIDTNNIEKMLIKRKINQTESLRARMNSGVQKNDLWRYVMNDAARLAETVNTRTKVAKYEALSRGKITVKENNLDLEVDYHVPKNNTSISFDWSADDANIAADFLSLIEYATDVGQNVSSMMLSRKLFSRMLQNTTLQKIINGNLMEGAQLQRATLENYLASEYGITKIYIADGRYAVEKGVGEDRRPSRKLHRYFPENKISFFATDANGRVGVGLWGYTPEEQSISGAYSSISNTQFITITQWATPDPAAVWTKASGLFVPVLPNPDGLFIATVKLPAA